MNAADTIAAGGDKRRAIVARCVELTANGLNHGTTGNISVRHGGGMLITPSGVACDALAPADIVFVHADGRSDARLAPSSEWRFHHDILARRADIGAVVHTHAVYSTVLSIRRMDIPPLHYMIALAGGSTIRCARYATFGTAALSEAAIEALGQRFACLLANHGMIACGATLAQAMALAVEVEMLARQYVYCLALGGPTLLDDAEIQRVIDKFKTYGPQPGLSRGSGCD